MNGATGSAQTIRHVHAWRIVLLVLAALLVALLLTFDWNWFKGPIERRVSTALGRPFRIEGDLHVDLGSVLVIEAKQLSLANAPWSKDEEMAHADMIRVEVPFWSLMRGDRLVRGDRLLRRLDVVRPHLLLERNASGQANWRFHGPGPAEPQTKQAPSWQFGELRVHEGELLVRDDPFDTDLRLRIDSIPVDDTGKTTRLLGQGSGRYKGHEFNLEGRADSPTALFVRGDETYDLDFKARAGATRARIWGALPVPLNFNRFKLHSQFAGDDLEDVYHLLGLALPSTPPYEVSGLLERDGRVVRMTGMQGKMGDSDVAGNVSIDLSGAKPLMQADLQSKRLDIDDLGGLIGAPPSMHAGETISEKQRAMAQEFKNRPRLLPDKPYDLHKLASLNANVRLEAKHVDAGKFPIERIVSRLQLQDSVLVLDPLDVGFAGGTVRGRVQLDARHPKIDASAKLRVQRVDLERLFPNMQPPNVGLLSAEIDLTGHGNSVADMLGTADGKVAAAMGEGRFSNLLLELAGLDVAESLKFLVGKDHTVKLRCAYSELTVEDGAAKAQSLVFDTTDTLVSGTGGFNFADESLALELKPLPKDVSPLSLRGPLEIAGTFKKPAFHPKAKPLLARVAAATALYALAPPAALLALIETGPGKNADCGPAQRIGAKVKSTATAAQPATKKKHGQD